MSVRGSVVINADDISLLRQVRDSRFIVPGQLLELLRLAAPGPILSRTFRWRVERLLNSAHIRRHETMTWQGSPIYSITPCGLMELEGQGHFAIALNSQSRAMPNRLETFHALELNAIRLVLARSGLLVHWLSEVEIASSNLVSPTPFQKDYDAIAKLAVGERVTDLALEYERTLKSAKRYAKIRAALDGERQVASILYLTPSPDLIPPLISQLTPLSIPIAFAAASSFRELALSTPVTIDASGRAFPLLNFLWHASSLTAG